jgi:sec-independent protein translocase protein TatB
VFGFSFSELFVISLVTLVAVGPQKLPGMLKTMGQWMRKLRKMTMDVRQQTGIDEMLRAEGIQLSELRSLMRGQHSPAPAVTPARPYEDPYANIEPDPTREYPPEGADAYGALPDDLFEEPVLAPAPLAQFAAQDTRDVPVAAGLMSAAPAVSPSTATTPSAAAFTSHTSSPAAADIKAPGPLAGKPPVNAPFAAPRPSPGAARPSAPPPSGAEASSPPPSKPVPVRPAGTPPPPPRRSAPPPPSGTSGPPAPSSDPLADAAKLLPPNNSRPQGNG